MNQVRKRLTYANVMSSIAVFLVLGGGAAVAANQLAKNSVGTKQLKRNAVTTAKIKKNAVTEAKVKANAITTAKIKTDAVTGAKVAEGTLGEVPSATTAKTADSAQSVDGIRIVKFGVKGGPNVPEAKILDFGGLQIFAKCVDGQVTAVARTTVANSEIAATSRDADGGAETWDYRDKWGPGDDFILPQDTHTDEIGQGRYTGGDLRYVEFTYTEDDSNFNECRFNGFAIG